MICVLLNGRAVEYPVEKQASVAVPRELFFCERGEEKFGVRYTDGSEKIVEDMPRNRTLYAALIDQYRESLDK